MPGFPSPFNLGLPPPGLAGLGQRSEGSLAVCDRESPSSSVGSRSASPHSIVAEDVKMKNARLSCSSVDGDCEPDQEVGGQKGDQDVGTQLKCGNDGCNQSFVNKHDKAKHERRCHNSSREDAATTYADKSPHS